MTPKFHEPKSVRSDARSWAYSLLLHGIVLTILVVGVGFGAHTMMSAPPGTGNDMNPVTATVVSQKLIDQQLAQIKAAEARKKAAQEAAARKRQQQIEQARKEREAEEARLAKLKQQREAAQKAAAAAAAQRKQEAAAAQAQLAKLQAKREAEQKAAAAAQAKAEAARKQAAAAAAARKKAAEEARRRKEAAAKAEAARKAELKKELEAEEQQRKEAAAAAQRKRERSRAMGMYTAGIRQAIYSAWNPPPSMQSDMKAVVVVTQVPGGDVVNVEFKSFNGNDAVKQSIISAIYKASPLPTPSDPSLFERQINITFTPPNSNGNSQ
ncbi:MAG TPA: cell envelope integrity protein TolA [Gammaproteobacteria bacterium]|nr:cell envelope integrity protein TolA [Gammaproteobacteria bacterium]